MLEMRRNTKIREPLEHARYVIEQQTFHISLYMF